MFTELKHIPAAWNKAFLSRGFKSQLLITIVLLLATAAFNFHCLREWQSREGRQLNDLIVNFLPPVNFSLTIFLLEYCTVLLVLLFSLAHPDKIVQGLQIMIVIILARTICVYLVPLEPPKDMIPLDDPLAVAFLHSKTVFVSKDLFFSGHVSMLTMLVLIASNKPVKYITIAATILVSIFIVWQHVHYSIDVIFAPVIAYASYRVVLFAHKENRFGLQLPREKRMIETREAEA